MHTVIKLCQSTLAFKARLFTLMPALLAITVLAFASTPVAHAQLDIPLTPIGNAYNPADGPDFGHDDPDQVGYGSVSYDYYIGTSFVTNEQYAIFLNAVAQQSDPHGLYNEDMSNNDRGGITRTESEGSYVYTVKDGRGDKPVTFVSFFDAARFCNWLTSGASTDPTSTETGMYTLADGASLTRNSDAWLAGGYALPTENEWYKAAYYNLTTETYTTWATGDTITTNDANYGSVVDDLTDAGHYNPEQNGTVDMMGNVYEWNEGRGFRGGAFNANDYYLASSSRVADSDPDNESHGLGFRVSSLGAVPEPATYGILGGAVALLGAVALRRRRG